MGGSAWPFLVGGGICVVNSVNERDLNLHVVGWGRVEGRTLS